MLVQFQPKNTDLYEWREREREENKNYRARAQQLPYLHSEQTNCKIRFQKTFAGGGTKVAKANMVLWQKIPRPFNLSHLKLLVFSDWKKRRRKNDDGDGEDERGKEYEYDRRYSNNRRIDRSAICVRRECCAYEFFYVFGSQLSHHCHLHFTGYLLHSLTPFLLFWKVPLLSNVSLTQRFYFRLRITWGSYQFHDIIMYFAGLNGPRNSVSSLLCSSCCFHLEGKNIFILLYYFLWWLFFSPVSWSFNERGTLGDGIRMNLISVLKSLVLIWWSQV